MGNPNGINTHCYLSLKDPMKERSDWIGSNLNVMKIRTEKVSCGEYPYGYNPHENIIPYLTVNPKWVVTQNATIDGFPP